MKTKKIPQAKKTPKMKGGGKCLKCGGKIKKKGK